MAWDTWGHHYIAPAWNFQHLDSACLLYFVAALLTALYSVCCLWIKWILTSKLSVWAQASMSSCHRRSLSVWLYLAATCRSLHCRHLACDFLIGSTSNGHMHWDCMSSHTTLWSIGMPSPKARYPAWQCSRRLMGINMSLIGMLPQLWVAGGCCVCSSIVAWISPIEHNIVWMSGSCITSFKSVASIIPLHSVCHSVIAWIRLCRKSIFGRSILFVHARYLTCCWYADKGPES